jgi:hypothetical protein
VTTQDPLRLLLGFEMGLYSRDDVSTWVFAEVERYDVIPDPLLELTVLAGKHDVDVANLLRALAPEVTPEVRMKMEIGTLREMVACDGISLHRAVSWAASVANDVSWDIYCEAIGLEDAYELAENGTYGTVADVERDIRSFLDRFALDSPPPFA